MAKKFEGNKVRICVDVTREDYQAVQDFNIDNPRPLSLPAVAEIAIKKAIKEIKAIKKEAEEPIDTLGKSINTLDNTVASAVKGKKQQKKTTL